MMWIEVANPAGQKVPKWKRSAALADDGTIFVPAIIAGDEQIVFLTASWDGVSVITDEDGHVFVPSNWVLREYPGTEEICSVIESRVREALSDA